MKVLLVLTLSLLTTIYGNNNKTETNISLVNYNSSFKSVMDKYKASIELKDGEYYKPGYKEHVTWNYTKETILELEELKDFSLLEGTPDNMLVFSYHIVNTEGSKGTLNQTTIRSYHFDSNGKLDYTLNGFFIEDFDLTKNYNSHVKMFSYFYPDTYTTVKDGIKITLLNNNSIRIESGLHKNKMVHALYLHCFRSDISNSNISKIYNEVNREVDDLINYIYSY